MLAGGLVAEVRAQLTRDVAPDAPGLDGIGYREVVSMLQGELPEAVLRETIIVATRRYAKRQETWFRNQLRHQPSAISGQQATVWALDATRPPETLANEIMDRWNQMADR